MRVCVVMLAAAVITSGCSTEDFVGDVPDNIPPFMYLSNGPVEGDTTCYAVHFYWVGEDDDGSIDHYEIAVVDGDPIGFDPADTTGPDKWTGTVGTDSLIVMTADRYEGNVVINTSLYGKFDKTHTFFIRAVDDRGGVSETVYRSFTAYTLAPIAYIDYPVLTTNPDLGAQRLSMITTFKWSGRDPIDQPWNYQEVDSFRYLHTFYSYSIETDLNLHPEHYEDLWSPWYSYHHPGDSGRTTVIGDDELLEGNRSYVFVVQAKDEAGAISSVYSKRTNIRHFMPMIPTGPVLNINEPCLGSFTFLGVDMRGEQIKVPPGFVMRFNWSGDASAYGGIVSGYRYGWDIADLNEPDEWDCVSNPYTISAVPRTYYSGVHTLIVESTDNQGMKTLGSLEVSVIPVVMTRDLLWVDDMPSSEFTPQVYAFPRESEHDEFWTNICLIAEDFDPEQDIWDVRENGDYPPPMELVWKYKNVIWSHSRAYSLSSGSYWNKLVKYSPNNLNYLPYYLAYGGHLWTEGEGHRNGSLAAVISNPVGQMFPCNLRCEFNGYVGGCLDTTGANSMAYRDFCVSVIDKVEGIVKPWVAPRTRSFDAMHHAVLVEDPSVPTDGFPQKLELWEQVTRPGNFFDPRNGGFHYVELYDTEYYMDETGRRPQGCFHPLYRQISMNTRSILNGQTVAFWYTSYANVISQVPGCAAAPSVHFGMPLWFFDRGEVDAIARGIFGAWHIPIVSESEVLARRGA